MNNYWIRSDVGSILVTARHINFAKPTMAGAGCKLAPLERSEAVELLKAQTADQNKGDTGEGWGDSEALTIVERAGYLPLTIQLSVGLVNYHDCTWAEFNKWWPRPRDVLKDGSGLVDNPDSKYGKNAQDVYVHLLSKLDEDSTSVVRIFSLLDPTTIREEWACTGWLAEKVKNGAKIVSGLKSRFILNPKSHAGGGGPRSVTMHRYVSDMVQAMMDPADKQAAFEGAVWVISSSLTHIWKSNMERIKQEFMDSVPHVLALNIFFKENKSNLGLRVPFEFIPMLSCAAA